MSKPNTLSMRFYSLYFYFFAVVTIIFHNTALAQPDKVNIAPANTSSFILRPSYKGSQTTIPESYLLPLSQLVSELKKAELLHINVEGHSDSTPLSKQSRHLIENNQKLSLERANNISYYLMQKLSLTKNQMSVTGFGANKPLISNDTVEGRNLNRRIEVIISTKNKKIASIPNLNKDEIKYKPRKNDKVSLSLRNTDIIEVMDMLSRKERVNILLSKDVNATISINLYDVSLDQAIKSIANSAGYAVEQRHGSYFIINRKDAGKYAKSNLTKLRTFKVQYTKPKAVEAILKNHLSNYGKITTLEERSLLVIEDTPVFLERIANLLSEIDQRPKQILIEAKILEITLEDSETFGLDWKKLFSREGGDGTFGSSGFASPGTAGFFLDLVTPNLELALSALNTKGRVRTLSTPKLLALENQEASVVIGDRIGYRLTTTINQVTTESIKFLESGVILKVKPSVDSQNRIMLDIHPEVSTGTVTGGIPSQKTTEVSTQLLINDGQTVFIGGLLKRTISEGRDSVPILGAIPLLGRLFSSDKQISTNTETVVMITPHIIQSNDAEYWNKKKAEKVQQAERALEKNVNDLKSKISSISSDDSPAEEVAETPEGISFSQSTTVWNIPSENIW